VAEAPKLAALASDPTQSVRRFPYQKQADGSWKKLVDPADTGGTYYIRAEDKMPFDDGKFVAGDEVASIVVAKFTGDRGDIATAIGWKDGVWTSAIKRKPVTGSETDVQFSNLDDSYGFGLAAFDNAQVRRAFHAGAIQFKFAKSSRPVPANGGCGGNRGRLAGPFVSIRRPRTGRGARREVGPAARSVRWRRGERRRVQTSDTLMKPVNLTSAADGAILLVPLTAETLPAWLDSATDRERAWLATIGFRAEPGTFGFLPAREGGPGRVVAGVAPEQKTWQYAGFPGALPEGTYRIAAPLDRDAATAAALGWSLGSYAFTRYKAGKRAFATLVWPDAADRAEVERLTRAVFLVRDLVNTPAEDMGPDELAAAARELAREAGATCTVIRGDELLSANYPTIHAVGRASSRPPCLIDLRWGDPKAPKVTLVGKGVCFDSGGLDLKTAAGMLHMKKDMGGGAVVLGLAAALMAGGAPIRLRVLVPAVENAVSANAIRPRDVIRTRSGKTVEIGNTDAEGRLILCDALAEADSEAPALIIDCATLTGAARIALGPELQALFCNDDAVADGLLRAGAAADDPLWRMPLWQPYRKLIDSRIADFNNVSDAGYAGAVVAAVYLAEFVRPSTPWAHIDMYAANAKDRPGRPEGGEATGLRAVHRYLRERFG
jgi:leucyl aminopeptidase